MTDSTDTHVQGFVNLAGAKTATGIATNRPSNPKKETKNNIASMMFRIGSPSDPPLGLVRSLTRWRFLGNYHETFLIRSSAFVAALICVVA